MPATLDDRDPMAPSSLLSSLQRTLVRALPDRVVFPLVQWRHGHQEPELRHLADFVPVGGTAVDVGAWMGPWTRALASRSDAVHAIEPQPALAAFLRRVAPSNVTVHEAAAGDEPGEATLVVDARPGRDQLARLGQETVEGVDPQHRVEHRVRVVTLDELELQDVRFVKIDVEGHELAALEGAAGLLAAARPVVLLEAEQRHLTGPLADVFEVVSRHGLDGWFLLDGSWRPLDDFDVEAHQVALAATPKARAYVNNFVFTPGHRPGR
ncbi:MAG: FkbM family methyltransferase [Acidimicrobiales bacterium]